MYYLKRTFPYLLVIIFTAITGYSVASLDLVTKTFAVIMGVLNFAVYVIMLGSVAFKDGQDAYKTLLANDLERKQIVKTGEDRPLKLKEEYKIWKGFFIGGLAVSPLVLLFFLDLVFGKSLNLTTVFGWLTDYLSMAIYAPIKIFFGSCFREICFVVVAINILICGALYYLGAKKIMLRQQKVKDIHNQIYGE